VAEKWSCCVPSSEWASEWHISELCTSTSLSWQQVRNKYGLENVCASDSNIQCYCNWVNSYGVMRWEGKRRNICSVISKPAGLLDRTTRAQHTFHFPLQIFWKHFSLSPFKELWESCTKMHVGCQVKDTLFVWILQ